MFTPSPGTDALIHAAKIFIQQNPELTALLIFLILVLDTLYVYRMLKRIWKKPSCSSANTQFSKDKHGKSD